MQHEAAERQERLRLYQAERQQERQKLEEERRLGRIKADAVLAKLKAEQKGERLVFTPDTQNGIYANFDNYPLPPSPDPRNQTLCEIDFNDEPATEWVTFSDAERGIELQIPYNPRWGNEVIVVRPFDKLGDDHLADLAFGPLQVTGEGGCGWVRSYYVSYENAESLEAVLERLTSASFTHDELVVKTINDVQVVSYEGHVFCPDYAQVMVLGPRYNYQFSGGCTTERPLSVLEKIAANAKFLE